MTDGKFVNGAFVKNNNVTNINRPTIAFKTEHGDGIAHGYNTTLYLDGIPTRVSYAKIEKRGMGFITATLELVPSEIDVFVDHNVLLDIEYAGHTYRRLPDNHKD